MHYDLKLLICLITKVAVVCVISNPASAQQTEPNRAAIKAAHPLHSRNERDEPHESRKMLEQQDVRVQAIQQRIDIIKEIMARKQAAAESATAMKLESTSTGQTPKSDQVVPLSANPSTDSLADTAPSKEPGNEASPPAETDSKAASQIVPNPLSNFQISTSPLNSMELANSLFVTGQYSQALKGYESLLADEAASLDQNWLRCLAANCYRVLGQIPAAERRYREVVSSHEKSYPADHAKWYLDHLTRRKQIQASLQVLDAELQPFLQKGR